MKSDWIFFLMIVKSPGGFFFCLFFNSLNTQKIHTWSVCRGLWWRARGLLWIKNFDTVIFQWAYFIFDTDFSVSLFHPREAYFPVGSIPILRLNLYQIIFQWLKLLKVVTSEHPNVSFCIWLLRNRCHPFSSPCFGQSFVFVCLLGFSFTLRKRADMSVMVPYE